MFPLIWFFLLFSVSGASESPNPDYDQHKYNSSTETHETAATRLCVILKCSSGGNTVESTAWYKCDSPNCDKLVSNSSTNQTQPEIISQMFLMDADLKKKSCSSVSELTDSELYKVLEKKSCSSCPTLNVTVAVWKQKPDRTLDLTEGELANLTCTVPSFCFGSKPQITWMWRAGQNDTEITDNMSGFIVENVTDVTQNHTSTLTVKVSTQLHNTSITCRVSLSGNAPAEETNHLRVMTSPRILNVSGCVDQSEFLICECISEGFPLPSISWPLLKNSTKYLLMNCTSHHSVKSAVVVAKNDTKGRNLECVSENRVNKISKTLNISTEPQKSNLVCSDQMLFFTPQENVSISKESENTRFPFITNILEKVIKDPTPFLVVFGTGAVIGMLFLSIIVCFVVRCHRMLHKNKKKLRNLHEDLEMVTAETFSKMDEEGIQVFQEDRIQDLEAAEGAAESTEPNKETVYADINDTDAAPKETVYSNINFSAMKDRTPAEVEKTQETSETEYAEIKKGETKERQDGDGEEGEMLEGSDEMEGIKEEDEEVKQGLKVPLYSNADEN